MCNSTHASTRFPVQRKTRVACGFIVGRVLVGPSAHNRHNSLDPRSKIFPSHTLYRPPVPPALSAACAAAAAAASQEHEICLKKFVYFNTGIQHMAACPRDSRPNNARNVCNAAGAHLEHSQSMQALVDCAVRCARSGHSAWF